MSRSWPRVLVAADALALALFAIAMALYPGGSWIDPTSRGHRMFENFFCDLLAGTARNGEPNPGAPLALAGVAAVMIALALYFQLFPRLAVGSPRAARWARRFGLATAALMVLVPWFPSGHWAWLHAAAIYVAGVPGVVAVALAAYALWTTAGARLHAALAIMTVLASTIDGTFYAFAVLRPDAPPDLALPALQKLSAALLLAWLGAGGVAFNRS